MNARVDHIFIAPELPAGTTHIHVETAPMGSCILIAVKSSKPGELVISASTAITVTGWHMAEDCCQGMRRGAN